MHEKPEDLGPVDENYPYFYFMVGENPFRIQLLPDVDNPNHFYPSDEGQARLNNLVYECVQLGLDDAASTAKRNLKEEWKPFTEVRDF